MLIEFFYALKKSKIPVSINEFLTLLEALKQNVISPSIDEFYYLARMILVKDERFYDKDILSVLTPDYQKLHKVLHNALSKMKIQTGDVFLVWRLKQMEQEGKVTVQGDWSKGWKEMEIKLPSGELFE